MRTKMFAVVAALLLSLVAANASHAQEGPLSVTIPFAFQVGNQTMPAGKYLVERPLTNNFSLERLRQLNGDAVMTISTVPLEVRNGYREPELIFNVYGKTYFLAQIWTEGSQGHELIKSKREKEVLRGVHGTEVALLLYPAAMAR